MTIRSWTDIKQPLRDGVVTISMLIGLFYLFFTLIAGGAAWLMFFEHFQPVHSSVLEFFRLSWYFWVPFLLGSWLYSVVWKKP